MADDQTPIARPMRRGLLIVEADDLVRALIGEQRAQQLVVEAVARLVRGIRREQRMPDHVQVADRIEHLVAHELVVVAQRVVVEDAVLVEHDRVVHARAARETHLAQHLGLVREAERARARDLAHVRRLRQIDLERLPRLVDGRVAEIDREFDLEAEVRIETRELVAVADFDGLRDLDETLGRVLLFDARGLQQEHERSGTAVHDRDFLGRHVDVEVVDTEARAGRHQMLDRRDARTILLQHRREARVADRHRRGRDIDRRRQIDAREHDARVRRGRPQRQHDLAARVQTDAGGLDDGFDGALLQHGGKLTD